MANPDTLEPEVEAEDELWAAKKKGIPSPKIWLARIKQDKADCEHWLKDARAAVAVYEAAEESVGLMQTEQSSFNILHSNIETTVPALYNSTPIPDVRRRYGDADQTAKMVVDIIERGQSYSLDEYDFDGTASEAVRDGELAGRGNARLRYKADTDEQGNVTGQHVWCEHIIWDRWGYGPARFWSEVPWVWFEHDLTKHDLEMMGVTEDRMRELGLDESENDIADNDDDGDKPPTGTFKTLKAYEIWDKQSGAVVFVAESDKRRFVVEPVEDPLQLEGFYPIPEPMMPLRKRRGLIPICPYKIYRPLVMELDKTTKRIAALIGQLRVRGLYDNRLGSDFKLLRDCEDGEYVAANDSTQFAAGAGGLEKAIAHWPLGEIIAALQQLYVQREQIKQTIYEVTGLSDVLRGATNPNETLGAQQLKAQVGSQRLSKRQESVARWCRDLLRMMSEIMCNHFSPQTLSAMTGIQVTPDAMQLLQNDQLRQYRIDIETDSTIRADVARSQEQMSLFLQGTAQYAQAMTNVLQLEPGSKAAIVQIYAAFARNFKLGKSAEDALEQMIEASQQPQEDKPDPEQQKLEAEQQRMQMQAQMDQTKLNAEMQAKQQESAITMQIKQLELQAKQMDLEIKQQLAYLDMQKAEMEINAKRESMALDQEAKVFDINSRRQMSEADLEARMKRHEMDEQAAEAKMEREADSEDKAEAAE